MKNEFIYDSINRHVTLVEPAEPVKNVFSYDSIFPLLPTLLDRAEPMKNEFVFDSAYRMSMLIEPAPRTVNMMYDATPRQPEADLPIIVVDSGKQQGQRLDGQD